MPGFCQTLTIILQRFCEDLPGLFFPEFEQNLASTLPGSCQDFARMLPDFCQAFFQFSGTIFHDFVRVSSENGKESEDESDEDSEKASERKRARERESEKER